MKIHCIGNPHIKEDSAPLIIADRMKQENLKATGLKGIGMEGIEFVKCYSLEDIDFDDKNNKKVIIVDTIKNIKDVVIINDIEKLKNHNSLSCHDIDLAFYLQVLKKAGRLRDKSLTIIGLPQNMAIKPAIKELKKAIIIK